MSRHTGVHSYSESIKFQLSEIYVLSPNAIIPPIFQEKGEPRLHDGAASLPVKKPLLLTNSQATL